uniref:kelch-like protein 12 isoform X1 n=1 Tax=Styela clava TaxID=7725 RepID=UPI0019399D05|nr:kelch-like protein 12 isoform X1 [Styela clava]XP_039267574.1 kelch-like protein 12 isoform X2 [Styela clava]
MEEKINTDSKEHAVEILQQLNEYRKTGRHCDFMIKAGSEELPVHKNIMSASSDYFKAILSHENVETKSGVVEIKEFDEVCVKKCVDFIYTGDAYVAKEKRETLMGVAHMMQLQRLCDSIAIFLEDDLDSKSFFQTKKIANMYNCKQLEEKCNQFALQRFEEIAQSDEFMDLDEKFISFLMESNETKAKEEGKCKMLLAWTKHDIDERKECFLSLVMKFQLTKMTLSYRRFLVENEPLIFESMQSIQSLTLSILDSHGDISSKDFNFNLTKNKQLVVFDQTSQRMHSLDVADKTWTPMQTLDQAIIKKLYSAVVMESYIYVICTNGSFYRLEYDESNAKWEQMTNTNLQYACVVALDGFVYGIEYGKSSNIMERYDPSNNRWTRLANKSLILAYESLVVADGKVFCIAGMNQQVRATNQVEIYDPVTSTWSTDNRSLNEARYCASATATEEGIYVIGGYVNGKSLLTTVEFRSSVTKAWVMLKPMKTARHWFGSCVIDEKVYVISGNGNPANIEEYDPEIKEWKIIETIPGKNIFPRATVAISI